MKTRDKNYDSYGLGDDEIKRAGAKKYYLCLE